MIKLEDQFILTYYSVIAIHDIFFHVHLFQYITYYHYKSPINFIYLLILLNLFRNLICCYTSRHTMLLHVHLLALSKVKIYVYMYLYICAYIVLM